MMSTVAMAYRVSRVYSAARVAPPWEIALASRRRDACSVWPGCVCRSTPRIPPFPRVVSPGGRVQAGTAPFPRRRRGRLLRCSGEGNTNFPLPAAGGRGGLGRQRCCTGRRGPCPAEETTVEPPQGPYSLAQRLLRRHDGPMGVSNGCG